MASKVLSQIDKDGNATVALNRPDVHNALDPEMGAQLISTLQALDANPKVRAVVIMGQGASFCAGADIGHMRKSATYSKKQNYEAALAHAQIYHTIYTLQKPTIARVHGAVRGGGMGIVAACDIAVGSLDATFRLSEVRLGIAPVMNSPYVVAAIGERQSRRYFLTAETFDAAEAFRIGLLHDIVIADELNARIGNLLAELYCGGPQAVAFAKRQIAKVAQAAIGPETVAETARGIAAMRATAEALDGVGSFLETRPAAWLTPAAPAKKTKKRSTR